jgi:CBS-domain-containing membrane protein
MGEASACASAPVIDPANTLQRMNEKRVEVLPVIDPDGRFMGVLSKNDLVDQMLLDLIAATQVK